MAAVRLTGQMLRVFELMKDGRPRELKQIARETGDAEASVSAQLRHLRKEKFGGHVVVRLGGLYQLEVNYGSKRRGPRG